MIGIRTAWLDQPEALRRLPLHIDGEETAHRAFYQEVRDWRIPKRQRDEIPSSGQFGGSVKLGGSLCPVFCALSAHAVFVAQRRASQAARQRAVLVQAHVI
jgi:hypothetical protein